MRTHAEFADAVAMSYRTDDTNPTPALYAIAERLNDLFDLMNRLVRIDELERGEHDAH